MKTKLEPCEECASTGFSDKVGRGLLTMEPQALICKNCGGRGWAKSKNER